MMKIVPGSQQGREVTGPYSLFLETHLLAMCSTGIQLAGKTSPKESSL